MELVPHQERDPVQHVKTVNIVNIAKRTEELVASVNNPNFVIFFYFERIYSRSKRHQNMWTQADWEIKTSANGKFSEMTGKRLRLKVVYRYFRSCLRSEVYG